MALLDGYQFNPLTFRGAGGLLDSLNVQQFKPGAFPNDPAALPQNAQPAQGQMPMDITPQQQQMPMQQRGFGDHLLAGLQGLGSGSGPFGALAGLVTGLATGEAPPAYGRRGSSDIMEYEYARKQGFQGGFDQWMQRKRQGAGEYSLTPVYGTDAQGNTVLIQPGKSGEAIQTKLPDGVKISSGVEKVDLGTEWGLYDKRTGNLVGRQPKDIKGKEAAEEVGKAQGQAQSILPQTKTAVESAVRVINDLRKHPGLEWGTGGTSMVGVIPGTAAHDFQAMNEQAMGKSFMAARDALKGAGQVTDFEGKKGEQAIANLKTSQSKGAYLNALDELERMLNASYEDLQRKAGVQVIPRGPAAQTQGKPDRSAIEQEMRRRNLIP
mgnify:CR=1 FL=1